MESCLSQCIFEYSYFLFMVQYLLYLQHSVAVRNNSRGFADIEVMIIFIPANNFSDILILKGDLLSGQTGLALRATNLAIENILKLFINYIKTK